MNSRIYFLDNLRTFLIFLVVVLHAGLVFESVLESSWIIVSPDKMDSLGLLRMYLDIFVMFSIFFISGYFMPLSAGSKSTIEFIKSKFNRIMIPWIVSVFTLIPTYKAIFLYARGLPQEPWYSYFHLFQRVGGNMANFADNPVQNWLWFLPVLFVFQLIYLALNRSGIFKFKISIQSAVLVVFLSGSVYAIAISNLGLRGWYHSAIFHFQVERLAIYFGSFLLGSLTYKLKLINRDITGRKYYIASNIILTLTLSIFTIIALNLFFNMIDPDRDFYFISPAVDGALYYVTQVVSMLCFLQIFIHLFRKYLNKTNTLLKRLNQNSYYLYIIHMPVIGLIGLAILNLAIPVFIKYILLINVVYLVSNIIAYLYRNFIERIISTNFFRYAAFFTATILSISIYIANANGTSEQQVPDTIQDYQEKPIMSLHQAAMEGNYEEVKKHILAGSNINAIEPSGGSTPLITAALFGKKDIVDLLLENGASINYQNNDGSTALHVASFFCHPEIVRILLQNGADIEIKNNSGATPLKSVQAPMETVKGIYQYFSSTLGPLGLNIDLEYIETTRPVIVKIISDYNGK